MLYGHRSRATPADIEVRLDTWCSYDESVPILSAIGTIGLQLLGERLLGGKGEWRGGNTRTYEEKRAKPSLIPR
jgi:hypothetical protein